MLLTVTELVPMTESARSLSTESVIQSLAVPSPRHGPRWYVVQCDRRALENLERQGFSCYWASLTVEKVRAGRKLDIQQSLFPGHLFIHLDEVNDDWQPIRSTRGVHQIVRFNEYPLPVPDEIVEPIRLRRACDPPHFPHPRPGERVLITDDPFSQFEAIFYG